MIHYIVWVDCGEGWHKHSTHETEEDALDIADLFDRAYIKEETE